MGDFLSKISSYNLFNYLFPGTIFCAITNQFEILNIPETDIVTLLFIYYFAGMIISRFGSLLLEPATKKTKLVSYSDYNDYLMACESDRKMEVMVEVSNTYRTVTAALLLIALTIVGNVVAEFLNLDQDTRNILLLVILIPLFLFSFRKQTSFISRRVNYQVGKK